MPDLADALAALQRLEGVEQSVTQAREACTRLRWHQALRRRTAEAAGESRVRGARASAALEGAERPLDIVRDLMRGALAEPETGDPVDEVVRSAIRATAATEGLRAVRMAPAGAIAKLHLAAMSGALDPSQVGRPRTESEGCRELPDLGAAPPAGEARARLDQALSLLTAGPQVSMVLAAAVIHAEIVVARPFVAGNAVVARAFERAILVAGGVDPTGVAVPEVGHLREGATAYAGALTAYATGSSDGVRLWLLHAIGAVTAGAEEGERVANAVLAGRLTSR